MKMQLAKSLQICVPVDRDLLLVVLNPAPSKSTPPKLPARKVSRTREVRKTSKFLPDSVLPQAVKPRNSDYLTGAQ